MLNASPIPCACAVPMRIPVNEPGPLVKAQWDIDRFEIEEADNTDSIIIGSRFMCCRGAISNSLKIAPSARNNAAEQASVEVSRARIFMPVERDAIAGRR